MVISVNELQKKNNENPSKITQITNELNELKEIISNLKAQLEQIQKDIEILKEGDNI